MRSVPPQTLKKHIISHTYEKTAFFMFRESTRHDFTWNNGRRCLRCHLSTDYAFDLKELQLAGGNGSTNHIRLSKTPDLRALGIVFDCSWDFELRFGCGKPTFFRSTTSSIFALHDGCSDTRLSSASACA